MSEARFELVGVKGGMAKVWTVATTDLPGIGTMYHAVPTDVDANTPVRMKDLPDYAGGWSMADVAAQLRHDGWTLYPTGEVMKGMLGAAEPKRTGMILIPVTEAAPEPAPLSNAEKHALLKKIGITVAEAKLLRHYALDQMNVSNGAEPESADDVGCYVWADEAAAELEMTKQGIGALLTSLQTKGLMWVGQPEGPKGSDTQCGFTPEGFNKYVWARDARLFV